jgi:protein-tyrosine phosphatase
VTNADYHYLLPNRLLAQGSAPPPVPGMPFDVIVLSAMEYQPNLPGYRVLHVPLDDGPPPDKPTRMRIRRAAREIADRVRQGQRVLVTCWQGRNRSGVLAGLAMVDLGVPPDQAVRRIQRLRDGLTNDHFRAMVSSGRI